jgi:2-polyprenyl-6-methoxyphenol hydroxylase-like FAD-dependent oxidoreductase
MAIDFLVVGGGIGGAVLAHLLGRRGKHVVILGRNRAPLPQNRPEILWPATVGVLRTLIPAEFEDRWMLPLRGGVFTSGGRTLLQFGPEVFRAAGVQMYSTANTRELLLQRAPCEWQRGQEVTRVLRDKGRVVGVQVRDTAGGAERDILAEWTVGDDGPHSVVRQGCGFPMNVVRLPLDLLGFSFDWPASLPPGVARIWLNEDRLSMGLVLMGAMPLPEGKGAAMIAVWREVFHHERDLRQALRRFAARDSVREEVIGQRTYPGGFTRFRIGWGRTPRFGTAGALLMGDAAHPVTPAGGQGANASVADALVIAEAALERPGQLLAEYERRRRAATQRSLSLSRGATRVLSLPRPVLSLGLAVLPWAARWLNNRPATFGRFLRTAAEAFRERPATGEEGHQAPAHGASGD